MKIGVPTEIKQDEYRVAMTPAGVRELTTRGHEVVVEAGAGEGSAISDADYAAQGATNGFPLLIAKPTMSRSRASTE